MLLRYLMNVSPNQWRPAIGQSIKVSLDHLPALYTIISENNNDGIISLNNNIYACTGG